MVYSSGVLNLDTASDIIPDTDIVYDLGSTTKHWDRAYLQKMNLKPYDTLTAYMGTPEDGEVIYIRDDTGGGGNPCLGVRSSVGWKKINFDNF